MYGEGENKMKTEKPNIAAGYIRTSTSTQWEKESPEIQRSQIQAYCKTYNLNLAKVYEDQISGIKDKRPGLDQLMIDATEGKFKHIIFTRIDRFGRSLKFILDCYEKLESYGITVHSIHERVDTSTEVGKLVRNVLGTLAEFERSRLKERTYEGLYAARASGHAMPLTKLPFGYAWNQEAKKVSFHDQQVPILKDMFRWFLQDKIATRQIAERLNQAGIKPQRGKLWQGSSVAWILRNSAYTGKIINYAKHKNPVEVACPPLLSPAQHVHILERMQANRDKFFAPPHVSPDDPFLLRGLILCKCGSRMLARTDRNGRYYACLWTPSQKPKLKTHEHKSCDMPRQRAEQIEQEVLTRIEFYLRRPERILSQIKDEEGQVIKLQKNLTGLQASLDKEHQRQSKLLSLFADGEISKPLLKTKLQEIEMNISRFQEQFEEANNHLALVQGKNEEIEQLRKNIAALRSEGVIRVANKLAKLGNRQKKEFLRGVIEDRLQLDQLGKPSGHMNLSAGYEYLSHLKSSRA